MSKHNALNCTEAMERIHAVLDGDLMDATQRQALDLHLEDCATCWETKTELEQIQTSLRGLTHIPFPDDAFQEVLAETSRAPQPVSQPQWGAGWRVAAAAVLLLGITASLWAIWPPMATKNATATTAQTAPNQAEIDQAAAEARMVLELTARAFARTQQAAVVGVMNGEVSPALNRVPMTMPSAPEPKKRDTEL